MIKSKRMRWIEHVAHMVGRRNVCRILLDNLKRKIMWVMESMLPKPCLGVEGQFHLAVDRDQ
jgi:hypothetical protein